MTESLPKVYPSPPKTQEQSSPTYSFLRCRAQKRRVILRYPGERDVYLDYHISRGSMPPSANLEFAL